MALTFLAARQTVIDKVTGARLHPEVETVALDAAAGRVLAEDIAADRDVPALARSVRDGYAVRAADRRIGLAYASSAAVFGASSAYSGGVVGDVSPVMPDTHYGVYKVANEGTARVYSLNNGIGSIGLRPFIVYGPGRDQGMTSDATKAILAAVQGEPFKFKFGGNMLLTYAPDCARAFIESARAAAGSGDALVLNVPGRRVGVAQLVALIEKLLPEAAGLLSWETKPISAPALLSSPALGDVIGPVANTSLEDGVGATIEHFRRAVADGVLSSSPS